MTKLLSRQPAMVSAFAFASIRNVVELDCHTNDLPRIAYNVSYGLPSTSSPSASSARKVSKTPSQISPKLKHPLLLVNARLDLLIKCCINIAICTLISPLLDLVALFNDAGEHLFNPGHTVL